MRKKTVTTIETHQIIIVRRPGGAALDRCPACGKGVEMVPPEEAAVLAGVSLPDILGRVGDGRLHFVETADGGLVCLPSLLNKIALGDGGLNSDGADTPSLPSADPSDAADQ